MARETNDSLLTPTELAKYLHLTEKTVLKLASEDKIPGIQIDKKWRFKRDRVDEWLEEQTRSGGDFQEEPDGMKVPLGDLLPEEGIIQDMNATNAFGAIEELVGRAYINRWLRDKEWMISALVEREGLASTAMDGGVAFLHTRQRDTGKLTRPFIIVGRSYDGIDFGAPDGKPTYLFYLLGLKYDKLHLPILGRLARIQRAPRTVAKLRATTSPVKMRSILLELDSRALNASSVSPLAVDDSAHRPKLDKELRLRAIKRINARKQYEARKAREEAAKKEAKEAAKKSTAKAKSADKKSSTKKTSTSKKSGTAKTSSKKSTSGKATSTTKKASTAKKPASTRTSSKKSSSKTGTKKATSSTKSGSGKTKKSAASKAKSPAAKKSR